MAVSCSDSRQPRIPGLADFWRLFAFLAVGSPDANSAGLMERGDCSGE